jgi:pyruvate formate lyase activating enzyme
LKLADNKEHIKFTGVPNRLIHKNLLELNNLGKQIRIRIPLIPGITDTEKNLSGISNLIRPLKNITNIDILPFNELIDGKYARLEKDLDLKKLKMQTEEELKIISGKFDGLGYEVSIRG